MIPTTPPPPRRGELVSFVPSVLKTIEDAVAAAREKGIDCNLPDNVTFSIQHDDGAVVSFSVPFESEFDDDLDV